MDRAESIEMFERLDNFADLRNNIRRLSEKVEEWAGIPMPLEDQQLVIDPSYKFAELLSSAGKKADSEDSEPKLKIRGKFWSSHKRGDVVIFEENGKVDWGVDYHPHGFSMMLQTLGCADAWGIEQESNAVHLLGRIASHRQFKHYMLMGMFLETSKRSGVTYLFRRLRPTVALSLKSNKILACLCMHSIGYYAGSWAGCLTPTDDVVAHLSLMRGDEHMFWRRCNQHPAWRMEAGL